MLTRHQNITIASLKIWCTFHPTDDVKWSEDMENWRNQRNQKIRNS